MAVTAPSSTTSDVAVTSTPAAASTNDSTVTADRFLKLLVAQMQNQDPSSSQDPNQSTQEMATFSMVEQITNLVTQEQGVAQQLGTINAVGMIGRTVSYTDTSGTLQSGVVQSVQSAKGSTTVTVDGQTGVDPTSIISVA